MLSAQQSGTIASLDHSFVREPEARHITLEQAQQQAAQANALASRLGELGVEAATQHRRAASADYFPKVGSTFANLHFDKFMGQEIVLNRPIVGGTIAAALPLIGQDQTLLAFTVAQPVTPLFKVREAVKLARADEAIAKAKAGMPVAASSELEQTYFDLLVAQREMALAEADITDTFAPPAAGAPSLVSVSARTDPRHASANSRRLRDRSATVSELTASLNQLLGWPANTRLELEAPAPLVETISLQQALDQALAANPEVIEAEQNLEKAKAASRLSKLEYVPDLVVVGGYVHQADVIPLLPRNFSFIGVLGTYNVFDSGKREHLISERSAQVKMAETALELTKAKVAAGVKTSFAELERSRALCEAAQASEHTVQVPAKYPAANPDVRGEETRRSLEAIQLDFQHRQAYAQLNTAIGK